MRRGVSICPTAGLDRNTDMVTHGHPDLGLTFIHNHSRGATHCLHALLNAGTATTVYATHRQPAHWASRLPPIT
jgi:hypothetical protein